MKKDLLIEKMHHLQSEYLILLKRLKPKFGGLYTKEVLDEINMFWYKNRNIVNLYLENFVPNNDAYVFTAITYLDVDANEQYPFMFLGKTHILDDPLGKYCELCYLNNKLEEGLFEQVRLCLDDNIKVLESLVPHIITIPFRLFNQNIKYAEKEFYQIGEYVFTSMFDGVESIAQYFAEIKDINQLYSKLVNGMEHAILFSNSDDQNKEFFERFNAAKMHNADMLSAATDDVTKFFMLVFGPIQQAIDIILSCQQYKCIPFIRYPVTLNYVLILLDNFRDKHGFKVMKDKVCVANVLYKVCDNEIMSQFEFGRFVEVIKESSISEKIFNEIGDVEMVGLKKIVDVVKSNMDIVVSKLKLL